jgi:hypothetical protein
MGMKAAFLIEELSPKVRMIQIYSALWNVSHHMGARVFVKDKAVGEKEIEIVRW